MESREVWILGYKFKLNSKNKWIVHSEVFGSSSSLFAKEKALSDSFGNEYGTIHVGVSTLHG